MGFQTVQSSLVYVISELYHQKGIELRYRMTWIIYIIVLLRKRSTVMNTKYYIALYRILVNSYLCYKI